MRSSGSAEGGDKDSRPAEGPRLGRAGLQWTCCPTAPREDGRPSVVATMVGAGAGRQLVAERGLTVAAVGALIPLMSGVGFEELGLAKALLKRFFSAGPWTAMDAAALATAIGGPPADAGDEVWVTRHDLDGDLTLVAGWVDATFLVDVEVSGAGPVDESPRSRSLDLSRTFGSGVVPQPTPNPRTLRFATARRAMATSETFRRGDRSDDERVAAIFAVADDVVDVLVGADFVAVSLVRPGRWPELLEPMLDVVASPLRGLRPRRRIAAARAWIGRGATSAGSRRTSPTTSTSCSRQRATPTAPVARSPRSC